MKKGDLVEVTVFGGEKVTRRVVADRGSHIVICNEEEYTNATKENREPEGIGFPKSDVTIIEKLARSTRR
jgi:hypothetical protein